MRVLITGATGFVGTYLTARLVEQGESVLGISRSARWRSAVEVFPDLKSVDVRRWDLREPASAELRQIVRDFEPDTIFHLAAISIPADCGLKEPSEQAFQTNVEGTRHVLDLMSEFNKPLPLILASSCHVYGMPIGDDDVVDESAEIRPVNGYGITKREAEKLVLDATEAGVVRGVVLRGFQQTGPLQSDRFILPEWARQFAERRPQINVRALETTLDLMDIRDSARAMTLFANHLQGSDSTVGQCFNIGVGERHSGGEIIKALCQAADYEPVVVQSSPGLRRNPIADVRRLRKAIDFEPRFPLEKTVAETYTYWRNRLAGT